MLFSIAFDVKHVVSFSASNRIYDDIYQLVQKTFKDFLKWYNNKDVVPTLEALQKMMTFYHGQGIDTLKLSCTLQNLPKICLHSSTNATF